MRFHLTATEVAEFTGFDVETIYTRIRQGTLKAMKPDARRTRATHYRISFSAFPETEWPLLRQFVDAKDAAKTRSTAESL